MVVVGLTEIEEVVAPLLHANEIPPEAVSVAEPPVQIDLDGEILQTGNGFTVTVEEQEDEQPLPLVTTTL